MAKPHVVDRDSGCKRVRRRSDPVAPEPYGVRYSCSRKPYRLCCSLPAPVSTPFELPPIVSALLRSSFRSWRPWLSASLNSNCARSTFSSAFKMPALRSACRAVEMPGTRKQDPVDQRTSPCPPQFGPQERADTPWPLQGSSWRAKVDRRSRAAFRTRQSRLAFASSFSTAAYSSCFLRRSVSARSMSAFAFAIKSVATNGRWSG